MKGIHQGFIIPEAVAYCFEYSIPELSLIEWVKENLTNTNKNFIDIGAHVGTWSVLLAPFFNKVYAFEPQKDVYNCLCGNTALHELSSKIKSYNIAICQDNKSDKYLYKEVEGAGGATLLPKTFYTYNEIVTSDALDIYKLSNIGLIKIDVEGSELDVVKGGVDTLCINNYPPILFECWQDERGQQKEELFQYIKDLGYSVSTIYGYPEMYLATHA